MDKNSNSLLLLIIFVLLAVSAFSTYLYVSVANEKQSSLEDAYTEIAILNNLYSDDIKYVYAHFQDQEEGDVLLSTHSSEARKSNFHNQQTNLLITFKLNSQFFGEDDGKRTITAKIKGAKDGVVKITVSKNTSIGIVPVPYNIIIPPEKKPEFNCKVRLLDENENSLLSGDEGYIIDFL